MANRLRSNESEYTALHAWLNKEYPRSGKCERCGQTEKPTEYANISGQYDWDREDFEELCHRCHMVSDGRIGPKSEELKHKISRTMAGRPWSPARRAAEEARKGHHG